MANIARLREIVNKLRDYNYILTQVQNPNPDAPIPELMTVWQWDDITGMPYFDELHPQWWRFVPHALRHSGFGNSPAGHAFITGMENNVPNFFIPSGSGRPGFGVRRSILCAILKRNVKKLRVLVTDTGIQIFKTAPPLLPFDAAYPLQVLRTSVPGLRDLIKTNNQLEVEINLNAARGQGHVPGGGPGTYWCREPHCTVTGPQIINSETAQWGPGLNQLVHLRKHFTCACNNCVYMLYCERCLNEGMWSTYLGQTNRTESNYDRNLHHRLRDHSIKFSSRYLQDHYPTPDPNIQDIALARASGDPDTDELLRDPYTHFQYFHAREDRKIVILDAGFPTNLSRMNNEFLWMLKCGSFEYSDAHHTGSLNHFQ